MPLDAALVDALTPEVLPPPIDMVSEALSDRDDASRRRWQWTQFLLQGDFADRVLRASFFVEQVWHAAVGLIPWRNVDIDFSREPQMEEAAHKSGYVWGGTIFTAHPTAPRVIESTNRLSFREQLFPIITRYAQYEPQVMNVQDSHGLLGTAACWARATQTHLHFPGQEGCVTAAHVLGSAPRPVSVASNGSSTPASVAAYGPPCIDCAFLRVAWPSPAPAGFNPLMHSSVASGDPVNFAGAVTSSVSGHVTHISAHAKYSGSGVPMILCHDGLGAQGDSGALVEVHAMPTAIHLGKIILDAGGHESRGLFLQQVRHVMQLDLYQ